MPGYDFNTSAGTALDLVQLGQIFADKVGLAYKNATGHAGNISKSEQIDATAAQNTAANTSTATNTVGYNATTGLDDAERVKAGIDGSGKVTDTTFDVGEMANFMLSMMVFGTLLKIIFSITSLIKDFGDFAAQKL